MSPAEPLRSIAIRCVSGEASYRKCPLALRGQEPGLPRSPDRPQDHLFAFRAHLAFAYENGPLIRSTTSSPLWNQGDRDDHRAEASSLPNTLFLYPPRGTRETSTALIIPDAHVTRRPIARGTESLLLYGA